MDGTSTNEERLIDAALRLTVERGWRELTLPEIAAEAEVSLADAYTAFPTKMAILNGFTARIDRQMLAEGAPDTAETVRDRLFDMVMRRFDALGPYKDAVAVIVDDLPADPLSALAGLPAFGKSMAWTLEAAGVSASGLSGALRIQGLAIIYLTTLRTWLQDDTADAARTMATLDRGLRRADTLISAFPGLRSRRPRPEPARDETQPGEVPPDSANSGDVPSGDAPDDNHPP